MNSTLLASIKERERAAAAEARDADNHMLLSEADKLMRESNALMAGDEDDEGNATSSNQQRTSLIETQRLLAVLKHKEQDLELAAKIGEALFQENTQLRKDSHALEAMRAELENARGKTQTLTNEKNALVRREAILTNNLRDSDATNEILTNKVAAMDAQIKDSQRQILTNKASQDERDNRSLLASQIMETNTSPRSATSRKSSPRRSTRQEDDHASDSTSEETEASALAAASAALAQSELISRQKCEEELMLLQNKLASAERSVLEHADRYRVRDVQYQEERTTLQTKIDELFAENSTLSDDLNETKELLDARRDAFSGNGERPRTYSAESGVYYSPGRDRGTLSSPLGPSGAGSPRSPIEPQVFSLEAELANAALHSPDSNNDNTQTQNENEGVLTSQVDNTGGDNDTREERSHRLSRDDSVDPYFFHFHMTAMSVKAHISLKGSTVGAGTGLTYANGFDAGGNSVDDTYEAAGEISRHAMNAINQLDTRAMYEDVVEQSIPPHHWIGYIRDAYSQAHIKSLLAARQESHSKAQVAQAATTTPKRMQPTTPPSSLLNTTRSGKSGNTGSVFGRLLRAVSTRMQSPAKHGLAVDVDAQGTPGNCVTSFNTAVRTSPRASGRQTHDDLLESPSHQALVRNLSVVSIVSVGDDEELASDT